MQQGGCSVCNPHAGVGPLWSAGRVLFRLCEAPGQRVQSTCRGWGGFPPRAHTPRRLCQATLPCCRCAVPRPARPGRTREHRLQPQHAAVQGAVAQQAQPAWSEDGGRRAGEAGWAAGRGCRLHQGPSGWRSQSRRWRLRSAGRQRRQALRGGAASERAPSTPTRIGGDVAADVAAALGSEVKWHAVAALCRRAIGASAGPHGARATPDLQPSSCCRRPGAASGGAAWRRSTRAHVHGRRPPAT